MPFLWQREVTVARNFDANGAPVELEGEMIRVNGNADCELCGRQWWRHPVTYEFTDWDGEPWLHVACDGTLLKL